MHVTNIQGLHEYAKVIKHPNLFSLQRSSRQEICGKNPALLTTYHLFLDDYSSVMKTDLDV